jgi:1,4-dihydroxy-6-naphthoate synthase
MNITMGFSPCPNDTFMFHDVAAGALAADGYQVKVHLHDVETLNELAFAARYDLTKMSVAASLRVRDVYQCLNSGAALGFGCGPLVVARRSFSRGDLAQARVAIPGEWTTAHLLFQLWAPPGARKLFVPYDRIIETVLRGEADAGILIHESRFVFAKAGLVRLADLGEWWEAETGLPIPLGCVMARKALGLTAITELDRLLKRCVEHSRAAPGETAGYVRRHAVEMDDDAIRQHIALYVTDYSADLGGTGREAMAVLERKAREAGVLK